MNVSEIETLLREKQVAVRLANGGVPQYILYWGDGRISTTDSVSVVHRSATESVVDEVGQRLLAFLTPTGVFTTADGGWVGRIPFCWICGNAMAFEGRGREGYCFCWINACGPEDPEHAGLKWLSLKAA